MKVGTGSAVSQSCLGRVFNFKLGCFNNEVKDSHVMHTATSKADSVAQILSCQIELVLLTSPFKGLAHALTCKS
jgi:hypothetical protein